MTIIHIDKDKQKFDSLEIAECVDYVNPNFGDDLEYEQDRYIKELFYSWIGEDREPIVTVFEVHIPNLDFCALFKDWSEHYIYPQLQWTHTQGATATIDTMTFKKCTDERLKDYIIQLDIVSIARAQLRPWTDDNAAYYKDFIKKHLANNVYFLRDEIRVERRGILFLVPPGTGKEIQNRLTPYLPQSADFPCYNLILEFPMVILVSSNLDSTGAMNTIHLEEKEDE